MSVLKNIRTALLISAPLAATFAPAFAATSDASGTDTVETVVVVGSRAENRSQLDTLAPVDVVSTKALENQGTTEFAQAMADTVPSLDFPRSALADATDSIRPATMRGLSPDQTLVLINGIRYHSSALVNTNGSVGRGSAAADLNTIPQVALAGVEVLRDGASAQYGSDAIAGVVNLRLKDKSSGGGLVVSGGENLTSYSTARGKHGTVQDGSTVDISGWKGLPLGDDGYLTVSMDYTKRNPTNRSDYDPRDAADGKVTAKMGDPQVDPQWTFFANTGKQISEDWQVYGWAGYQNRHSKSSAFPRLSNNADNVTSIYPNGFVPQIAVNSQDITSAIGSKGTLFGWNSDFTVSYGNNTLYYRTEHSLNSTYGDESQTSFYDGSMSYDQWMLDANFTHPYDLGLPGGDSVVAFGLEQRWENYKIGAGEHASYDRGDLGDDTSLTGGAQGFIGFSPDNAINKGRHNFATYVDVSLPVTEQFNVEGALRYELYSDFGHTITGKISARYDVTDHVAFRGSFSTGFRAPSLQQSYFTSTSSVIDDGEIVETGTYPSTSSVAESLGGKPLKAEKSKNYSVGSVLRWGNFNTTIDGYWIDIHDQIVLSELIEASDSDEIAAILEPQGVDAARFFINGASTRTRGIDVVTNYAMPETAIGDFNFTMAFNYNDVSVTKVPTSTSVVEGVTLFARARVQTMENGTPEYKAVFTTDWSLGNWGSTLRATYYGDVEQPGSTLASTYWAGNKMIFDLEVRRKLFEHYSVAIGADNILDSYPKATPASLNSNGVIGFTRFSPYGFNGRYIYARLSANF